MDTAGILEQAYQTVRELTSFQPELGLVLGSGLGDYGDAIQNPTFIPYSQLPGFPVSTVSGHAGRFILGERLGRRVIAMQGRFHYYEGYPQQLLALPVRLMKRLGADKLVLTNAAGGVNPDYASGTLMLISDHINYSGANPLIGPNQEELGPRFPDMSRIYSREARRRLKEAAAREGIALGEGVYMMFSGPNYETPAEVRMARILGADAVGMSTVPEAIAAAHCGMQVLGISCITNPAAGVSDQPLSHSEVMETAARVKADFVRTLDLILQEIF